VIFQAKLTSKWDEWSCLLVEMITRVGRWAVY
jgi:hypothetical protein